MADRRMISTGIWQDEFVGSLNVFERMVWVVLVTCVDDQGRMINNPVILLAHGFPYDRELKPDDVKLVISKFEKAGKVILYEAGGKLLLQLSHWWKYQNPAWPQAFKYPPPKGWQDRYKMHVPGNKVITLNMDKPGGFGASIPGDTYTDNSIPIDLSDSTREEESSIRGVSSSSPQKNIFTMYTEIIGSIPPTILVDELKDYELRHPPQHIQKAFEIAAGYNKRNWAYPKSILDRWEREGYDGDKQQSPRKNNGTKPYNDTEQRLAQVEAAKDEVLKDWRK